MSLRAELPVILERIQNDMLAAARARLEANTIRERISYERFKEVMEGPGAFVYAGWNGDPAVEAAREGGDQGDHPRASLIRSSARPCRRPPAW